MTMTTNIPTFAAFSAFLCLCKVGPFKAGAVDNAVEYEIRLEGALEALDTAFEAVQAAEDHFADCLIRLGAVLQLVATSGIEDFQDARYSLDCYSFRLSLL